ncbi:MAG: acetolactate synthase small subunit [Bacillota bacterium]|nr:acetolactate synthase small subunit [Bacillota bacterium]
MNQHILSVLVNNQPGLLYKVSGMFSRRGFNIESLAVGVCEIPGCSRMTIVVNGDNRIIDQVMKQLNKLIDVIAIEQLPVQKAVRRELILVKVQVELQNRQEVIQIAEIFRARIVDVATSGLTLELTGTEDKLSAFIDLLEPFTVEQIMRTGLIAVGRF